VQIGQLDNNTSVSFSVFGLHFKYLTFEDETDKVSHQNLK